MLARTAQGGSRPPPHIRAEVRAATPLRGRGAALMSHPPSGALRVRRSAGNLGADGYNISFRRAHANCCRVSSRWHMPRFAPARAGVSWSPIMTSRCRTRRRFFAATPSVFIPSTVRAGSPLGPSWIPMAAATGDITGIRAADHAISGIFLSSATDSGGRTILGRRRQSMNRPRSRPRSARSRIGPWRTALARLTHCRTRSYATLSWCLRGMAKAPILR